MEIIVRHEGNEWKMELPAEEYTVDGQKNVPALAASIHAGSEELGRQLLAGIVTLWSSEVFLNKEEQDRMGIAPKDRSRTRVCVFDGLGAVELPSHVYKHTETGECFTLLNEMWGMNKGERVQERAKVHAASLASEYPYRKTAALPDLGISCTTVFNAVHAVEVPGPEPPAVLRKAACLYADFDEGHPHTQIGKCLQLPVGMVSEGRKEICKGRNQLIGRKVFVSSSTKELLADIEAYIYTTYDLDYLKVIYVRGDGASWICQALDEAFPNVVHVHDAYHWMKVVGKVSHLFPHSRVPERVRKAVQDNDHDAFTKIMQKLKAKAGADKKALKAAEDMERYYTNHWDAIRFSMDAEILGSCTEPLVQHLLAARTTAVPCGWSPEGVAQIAAIRAFLQNGGQLEKLKLTDEERSRSCRAQYEDLKASLMSRPLSFDIFDNVDVPYDGDSGTCRRLAQIAAGGNILQE